MWRWWHDGSVHAQPWPTTTELASAAPTDEMIDPVCGVLALVRRAKTEAKVSQRAAVERVVVHAPHDALAAVRAALPDVRDAGSVAEFDFVAAEQLSCDVTLAPVPAADATG